MLQWGPLFFLCCCWFHFRYFPPFPLLLNPPPSIAFAASLQPVQPQSLHSNFNNNNPKNANCWRFEALATLHSTRTYSRRRVIIFGAKASCQRTCRYAPSSTAITWLLSSMACCIFLGILARVKRLQTNCPLSPSLVLSHP